MALGFRPLPLAVTAGGGVVIPVFAQHYRRRSKLARWLKQSTSADVPIGPFVDATDGVTAETGLTITQPDIRLKKNGSAWAQKAAAQTLSHEENGYYEVTLDATDTDTLGLLRLAVNESGAIPIWEEFLVVPANVWDSFFAADLLQIDLTQIAGAAVNTASAQIGVNVVNAAGTAWNSGAIGAATLAADTITAAKIATNAIGADELADGAITAATFAAGAIDATAIATGAIDADAIAADAITAAKVAADVSAEIADAVWDEDATGHQTGGTFGQAIGDPAADTNTIYGAVVTGAAGATIAADIVAVKAETADILADTAEIGAAGAGLTAINLPDQTMNITGNITGNLSGSVGSVTGAVGSVTGNVGGNVTGTIGGLTAAALKDFFDTDSATTYASAVAGSVVKEIADNAGGSGLTAAAIADAVWDEAQADHVAVGSFGITASEIADILLDTAEIGAAGAGLTNINLPNQTMDIVGNITGNLSGSVGSVTGAVGSVAAGGISAASFAADAITAAKIAADVTTELQSGLATAASITALDGKIDTIDDFLDTEVAAIKAKTDSLTFTVAGKVDANTTHISGSSAAADNLEAGAEALVESTCAAGSTTTSIVTNLTEATDDHYNGRVITFITGALVGQSTNITDYNGTTKTMTVTALTEAPADTDGFVIS